jgi:hypothetical protein
VTVLPVEGGKFHPLNSSKVVGRESRHCNLLLGESGEVGAPDIYLIMEWEVNFARQKRSVLIDIDVS